MNMSRLLNVSAGLVALAASAMLATPATAAANPDSLLACTASQRTQIQADIKRECGGSGTARVYCSWTGLYEVREYICMT